jgi:hypothetical protein
MTWIRGLTLRRFVSLYLWLSWPIFHHTSLGMTHGQNTRLSPLSYIIYVHIYSRALIYAPRYTSSTPEWGFHHPNLSSLTIGSILQHSLVLDSTRSKRVHLSTMRRVSPYIFIVDIERARPTLVHHYIPWTLSTPNNQLSSINHHPSSSSSSSLFTQFNLENRFWHKYFGNMFVL